MTQNEFAAWLNGFLDGKLSPDDLERVQQKALTVMPEWPTMPIYPWRPVETGYQSTNFNTDAAGLPPPGVTTFARSRTGEDYVS